MDPGPDQVTLLPEQLNRLARVGAETGTAIAISQKGCVIHVRAGNESFAINAKGENIYHQEQETLC